MTDFLKRIGLIDNFQIIMEVDKTDFIKTLASNLDEPQADFFDVFSRSKNVYKGKIEYDQFTMKRRKRLFDSAFRSARVHGKLSAHHEKLAIDLEIHGFYKLFIPVVIVLAVFYAFGISALFFSEAQGFSGMLAAIFILVHATFMFGIPYFALRRAVSNTREDVERDLYFMMKDKLHARA